MRTLATDLARAFERAAQVHPERKALYVRLDKIRARMSTEQLSDLVKAASALEGAKP